jgi:hypothetical protein
VRPADPLTLVIERHATLAAAVDLHIGGVQVDRHVLAQHRGTLGRQRGQRRRRDVTEPGLHRRPLPLGEPVGQPGRGRRRQPRYRGQLLAHAVGALTVQPDEKSSPASCAAAIPTNTSPAVCPRRRCLNDPIAASNRPITSSRSTSSVTAISPENRVSDSSGAPTCTRARRARRLRTLRTR